MPDSKSAAAPPPRPAGAQAGLAALVGAAAAAILYAAVPAEEGTEYRAYRDIAGIWTICSGDTADVRAGQVATPAECRTRLERQLIAHAAPVLRCTPRLGEAGRDNQRAAAVSLAYNIGAAAYCRSGVDRAFDAGEWRRGCDAFLAWNKARVNGQLRAVRGLTLRRRREREI